MQITSENLLRLRLRWNLDLGMQIMSVSWWPIIYIVKAFIFWKPKRKILSRAKVWSENLRNADHEGVLVAKKFASQVFGPKTKKMQITSENLWNADHECVLVAEKSVL